MDIEPHISLERSGRRGRYVLPIQGSGEAELTFVESDPGHLVIDHSFVPPEHRGRGIARRLVERAVADARVEGSVITPLCPYVAALFRRHPDWSDLLKR